METDLIGPATFDAWTWNRVVNSAISSSSAPSRAQPTVAATAHPRVAGAGGAGWAAALAAERVPERRDAEGAFAGAFVVRFAAAFAGAFAPVFAGALDARAGAFERASVEPFALVEAFAVVLRGFAGLFGEAADSFAGGFDGAFADPLADRPEASLEERPEPLLGASDPLLYSELASGGVAFMRACPRAQRIQAMETPSR